MIWRRRHLVGLLAATVLVATGCAGGGDPVGGSDSGGTVDDGAARSAVADGSASTPASTSSGGDTHPATARPPSESADAPSAEPEATEPEQAELAWAVDARILSEPAYADGVAVVYRQDGEVDLTLAAYDAATGEELWSADAAPSVSFSTAAPHITTAEDRPVVIALAPTEMNDDRLVALDLTDGTEVARAPHHGYVTTFPRACFPDDTKTCLTGWSEDSRDYVDLEASVHGRTIRVTDAADDEATADEDRSWFDAETDEAGVTRFTYHRDGDLAWEVPVEELGFEVGTADTPFGSYRPGDDVIVSSVNWMPSEGEDRSVAMDTLRVVAFDIGTGEVLWSRVGALTCGPGRSDQIVPVCSGEGELDLVAGTTGVFRGENATMAGLELRTGEEVWSRDLSSGDWAADEDLPRVASHMDLMLVGAQDPVLLDIVTGEPALVDADEVDFVCIGNRSWNYGSVYSDADERPQRITQALGHACTRDGEPTEFTRWPIEAEGWGTDAGDLQLIARPDRLEAYRVG